MYINPCTKIAHVQVFAVKLCLQYMLISAQKSIHLFEKTSIYLWIYLFFYRYLQIFKSGIITMLSNSLSKQLNVNRRICHIAKALTYRMICYENHTSRRIGDKWRRRTVGPTVGNNRQQEAAVGTHTAKITINLGPSVLTFSIT
jgi:hypothetical protein